MADPDFGAFVRTLGDDARRVECAQIQRIYGGDTDAQLVVKGDSDVESLTASTPAAGTHHNSSSGASTVVVSLRFLPLDTDFPPNAFPVDNRLGLRFELGPDYPAHAPPAVTVLPMLAEPAAPPRPLWEPAASGTDSGGAEGHAADDGEEDANILHKAVSTAVDMFVQSRGGRPCVLATLRWLDKNLVAVLETATFLQQQRRERLRQAASLSKPPPGTSGAVGGGASAGDEGEAGGGGHLPTESACATVEPERSSAASDGGAPKKALNPAATAFKPPAQQQQQQQQQQRRQPPQDRLRQQRRKQQQQSRQQPSKQKPATAQKRRTPKQQPPQQQRPQQQQQRRRKPPAAGAAGHKVSVGGPQPRLQQRRKRPPGTAPAADAGTAPAAGAAGAGDAGSNPIGGDRGSSRAGATAASPAAPATAALAEEPTCKWTPRLHAKFEEALQRFWVWATPLQRQQQQRPSSQSGSLSPGSEVSWRRRGDMQARWQTIAQATGGGLTAFDCVKRYREVRAALFQRQQQRAADGLVSEDEDSETEEEEDGGSGGGGGGDDTDDDATTGNAARGNPGPGALGASTLEEDLPADSSCAAEASSEDETLRPVLSSAATGAGRGVRVSLINAQSTGLALVQCAGLALQVKCGRCGADDVVRFAARMTSAAGGGNGGAAAGPAVHGIPGCRRCGYSSGCRVAFEAAAVALGDCGGGGGGGAAAPQAAHRNTLAFLRLREGRSLGVNIVGLAEASLLATCESCGGEELLDKVRMDHGVMGFCARCHEKRALSVTDGVKFLSIGLWAAGAAPYTATAAASAALKHKSRQNSRKLKKQRQEFGGHGVVKGSPLPNNGACKHYGRSRRWYRFPCCGLLFPCDECHAEARVVSKATAASAAILDDSNVCERDARANKMVCGLCSTEQGLAKSCKSCKCDVTGSAAGKVFWEGGVGQRDATKRSNKDPTKMRGRNKTVSRKKALQGKHKQ